MQGIKLMSLDSHKYYSGDVNYNEDYIYFPDFKVLPTLTEPYRSDYYCIGLHLEGELTFYTNLIEHRLTSPSIILADKTVLKRWDISQSNHRTQSILIADKFIKEVLSDHSTFSFLSALPFLGAFIAQLSPNEVKNVSALFQIIDMHTPAPTKLLREVVRGAVYSLISYVASLYANDIKTLDNLNDYFLRFLTIISEHAAKERNIGYYAQRLGIHAKYLGHIVKARTGLTAGDWIKKQIILEAKVYLQKPDLSIAEIADKLGFPDQSTFGKYFKKHGTGIGPLAYRKYVKQLN